MDAAGYARVEGGSNRQGFADRAEQLDLHVGQFEEGDGDTVLGRVLCDGDGCARKRLRLELVYHTAPERAGGVPLGGLNGEFQAGREKEGAFP